ncbi:MAG: ATP-dependent DNA helicase RecG [Elusimicrobiota bacterium]|jgi:ATP-dependent DNA helicase RecG|nr:ATP-dependent DNA helicase RecG [Elusimicrobiota bacterium]
MPDIKYIKGVGPAKAALFNNLEVQTVSDLLHYYPRAYQDRRQNAPLSDFKKIENIAMVATVLSTQTLPTRYLTIFKAFLQDDKKNIYEAVWFRKKTHRYDPFAAEKKDFKIAHQLWIIGKREDKNSFASRKITVDEYYPLNSPEAKYHTGCLTPLYSLTQGLTNKFFRNSVATALQKYLLEEEEVLPPSLLAKRKLLNIRQALPAIHFPSSVSELENARRRMVYEEFLLMTMAWGLKQKGAKAEVKEHSYTIKRTLLTPFKKSLGYHFTKAQARVINEIFEDMQKPKPMTRLLQGDVGSGKTVVAISAILLAIENGYQAAFMAPTEILASQHYITLQRYLKDLGVSVELLTSKTTKKEKDKILQNLKDGKIDIIIGTHSLIEDNVEFKNLRFIVVDEQHRFGVKQRAKLRSKAKHIDMLSMTATPIPRTFALAFYGNLDVSTIDELPPGRKPIKTLHVGEQEAFKTVRAEISKGRQAYIVYPLIDESDKLSLKAATQEFERLKTIMPEFKIAMIHGVMKSKEKQKIMEDFLAKKTDILVATPVIEVGIDVKNATVMVVQNAERFGLASLHQLRGRVGRGEENSTCLLITQNTSALSSERINTICQTCDGFKIGEKDLELRGPGEILGTRQSGELEFKAGDIVKDSQVLHWAVEDRNYLTQTDPNLTKAEHQPFKKRLLELYQKQWHLIDLG